ncbi:MAG TPA: hypothetical protein PK195_11960, partial [Ignavibacteriaceae bacterium]|nr:hypothetical protein [Ignavibacteriaceae bacterium]
RVAVCEQMENSKFAKGIVKREVVEVVTPGVTLSDKLLDHKKNNYLLSIVIQDQICGLSFCDISTAEFYAFEIPLSQLGDQIESINPSEFLISKRDKEFLTGLIEKISPSQRITKLDDWIFNFDFANELLKNHFKTVTLKDSELKIFQPELLLPEQFFII